ncbi:MAG: HAMP domain-containing histidine kinase [Clostridia bacterium]|nr:HAMP domain-containing histidine kinase [Clostridia bacterium]
MTDRTKKILKGFSSYAIIFISVAFLVTCTTALFVSVLSTTLGISLDSEQLNAAAKLTFANVVFISLLITVIDGIRRRLTTKKTIAHIVEATERVIGGDFSVRIEKPDYPGSDDFEDIINSFNKMAEELSGVEALRGDFISNVSHEMKTPLAVIENYTRLLSAEGITEEGRAEYTAIIRQSSRRLSSMITNILKLNKLEHQKIFPKSERFNLTENLAESLFDFESVWEKKNIRLDTYIEDDVYMEADRELLSLVWNNLLSNAFKFTEEGGRVTVVLCCRDSDVIVRVADTGCGMSREVGAHIFDKFYQGDTSHATEGNGLGLALVKRVVDILGGEIYVESTLGEGSAFTVSFRRCEDEK